MKIAIYHNLPSGGAKRMLFELASRLTNQHEFTVYSFDHANHTFSDLRPLAKTHHIAHFKPTSLFRSPFGRFNQLIRLYDLNRLQNLERQIAPQIEKEGFDLIWVHPCQSQNSPSILRFIKRTPTLFFCQEPLRILYEQMPPRPYDKKESPSRKIINRLDPLPGLFFNALKKNDFQNIQQATRVTVNSQFMKKTVGDIYPIQPHVNYAGVNIDFFHPNNTPKEDFVFSVGSLTPLKGFDFVIRSIGLIPEKIRPAFKLAGNFENAPERNYLQELAKQQGVDLQLEVGITDKKLMELYNQAKITVYSPHREPFGMVAIESMACGTPVVGVKEGGLLETILDGKTGYLTERDEQAFANAIQDLLNDPQKREQYGKASREEAQTKWSWESSTKMLENHFQAVLMS